MAMHVCDDMERVVAHLLERVLHRRLPTARSVMRALSPWTQHRAYVERELTAELQVVERAATIRPTVHRPVAAA